MKRYPIGHTVHRKFSCYRKLLGKKNNTKKQKTSFSVYWELQHISKVLQKFVNLFINSRNQRSIQVKFT